MDTCGWGEGEQSSMWTQKIFKLEPTDVILSSSRAKELAFSGPEFSLWME